MRGGWGEGRAAGRGGRGGVAVQERRGVSGCYTFCGHGTQQAVTPAASPLTAHLGKSDPRLNITYSILIVSEVSSTSAHRRAKTSGLAKWVQMGCCREYVIQTRELTKKNAVLQLQNKSNTGAPERPRASCVR